MTFEEITAAFERHQENEYLKFDHIPEADRRHPRPDICAFLLLHEKCPGDVYTHDMVTGADHDVIFLSADMGGGCTLTDDDVIYLVRCGVRWDEQYGLNMFV